MQVGTYKTRQGQKAIVLATGAPGAYPLVGYVEHAQGQIDPQMWTADGIYLVGEYNQCDLVAEWRDPPKSGTHAVWVWLKKRSQNSTGAY